MRAVLLRVGIDSGSGGMQGPLFRDGTFEYIPIPDTSGLDPRTYGSRLGRKGRPLVSYFPAPRQHKMADQSIHVDPEFATFTYGDPSRPKASLRHLQKDDLLIFYCGLEGWDFHSEPALYLLGYFEILTAGRATDYSHDDIRDLFGRNFHVRNSAIFRRQRDRLVLVKGTNRSRLLTQAVKISANGQNRAGKRLKVLAPEMSVIFGNFDGKISLQRSPPRWIDPEHVQSTAEFVRSLA